MPFQNSFYSSRTKQLGFGGLLFLGLTFSASAKTLCVNPGASAGCYGTIGAAVAAAAANDVVNVAPGQYAEDVIVTKSLSLVGAGSNATIINAKGLPNGIYVNGLDNGGLMNVTITGFSVVNANYEGILLTNTGYSLVTKNHVASNDQNLAYGTGVCAGIPIFETNEADDCGEGIHLVGVNHSTVSDNLVELNGGGILLSDETGSTYENVISGNTVRGNALDCGITLASHAPSPQAASKLPYGVFNNNIVGNSAIANGLVGAGAGIGIFAPGPGNLAYGNKVIGNTVLNNGLPGVTVHNHAAPPGAPASNLNDIVIMNNYIAGNAADDADAKTTGTAGINIYGVAPSYGTRIVNNTIQNEDIGVVINNPGAADIHLNNFLTKVGVAVTKGSANASMNFYGCAGGPGATGCGTVTGANVVSAPALTSPESSAPATQRIPGR